VCDVGNADRGRVRYVAVWVRMTRPLWAAASWRRPCLSRGPCILSVGGAAGLYICAVGYHVLGVPCRVLAASIHREHGGHPPSRCLPGEG
jgi:hypothetical protein